jgi:hypothetical protein
VDYGYNVTAHSEMSYMFYLTLGDKAYVDTSGMEQLGWGLTNTGPFSDLRSAPYWSATEYAPTSASDAWYFDFYGGSQGDFAKTYDRMYAWAVHSGDVGAAVVPVPAAAWLFGSGIAGLIGFARRRSA